MMALHLCAKLLVGMVISAACISVAASLPDKSKRHAANEESSSHQLPKVNSHRSPNLKSPVDKNGEVLKPEKKMIHRLIGGHLKLHRKAEDAKDERDKAMWDDGLLMSSAGNGKEKKNSRDDDDDEKKTLSQQVKEGKYGLIQNEIYPDPPKRPGIISYLGNPEVPKDTIKNLGGLEEEEIWLAENHVLVLRGGKFPDHTANQGGGQKWPAIDDYKAPERQVKIPSRPKVPPPFPVQLTEGGPIQIIRANGSHPDGNGTVDYDTNYSQGFLPGETPFYPIPPNTTFPELGYPGNSTGEDGQVLPFPYPDNNGTYELPQGFQSPDGAIGPFYPAIPPGAVFLPPPNNQTEYDDDDQSIYYPPPYSFYYQQDNSTAVPPGPLVPGIILPPPPNFFSSLEKKKATTKGKYNKRPITTAVPNAKATYLPPRKLTTKSYKARVATTTPIPLVKTIVPNTLDTTTIRSSDAKPLGRTKCKNMTIISSTKSPQIYYSTIPYIESSTPRPEKSTTLANADYYNVQAEIGNHVTDSGSSEKGRWPAVVSSTAVPLLAYYATTPSSLEKSNKPIISSPKHTKSRRPTSAPDQASYYFYEETSDEVIGTTTAAPLYYKTTTESPYYSVESLPQQRPKKQYYSVEMIPSQQTAKDYNIKLLNALVKPALSGYQYSDPDIVPNPVKYDVDPPRVQGQRMLVESDPRYYQSVPVRHQPTIKPYYTSPRPQYYYQEPQEQRYDYRDEQAPKTKPVYQYSYEAADYEKQRQQQIYQPEQQGPASYNDYQQPPNANVQYYDSEIETLPEEQQVPQRISYRAQQPIVYSTTTVRPGVVGATPDPQHAYYTKQDEQLLDDVTKQYFTIFGKKLPDGVVPSTTPIYRVVSSTTENPAKHNVNTYVSNQYEIREPPRFKTPKVKVHYGDHTQRPYSLKDDTLVNYKNPLPPINPDSEFIPIAKPIAKPQSQEYRIQQAVQRGSQSPLRIQDYRSQGIVQETEHSPNNFVPLTNPRDTHRQAYPAPPLSLEGDIAVNYRNPRPPINPDAEFIAPIQGHINHPNKAGSYFAYQLPGNGGHFYFLTPQAVSQRQDVNGGYLYPKPTGPRLIRRRRDPAEG